jgi:two-component system chemotaxis response regulator CheB
VHVAQPDLHLVLRPSGRLRLVDGPAERGLRPSGDVLLRSVANASGARGAAVLLQSSYRDGFEGAASVRAAGGCVLKRRGESGNVIALPRPNDATPDRLDLLDGATLASRLIALAGGEA